MAGRAEHSGSQQGEGIDWESEMLSRFRLRPTLLYMSVPGSLGRGRGSPFISWMMLYCEQNNSYTQGA